MKQGVLSFYYNGHGLFQRVVFLPDDRIDSLYYQDISHEYIRAFMQHDSGLKRIKVEGINPEDIKLIIEGQEVFHIESFTKL